MTQGAKACSQSDRVETVRVLPWGTGAMVARGACELRGRFELR